jgi:ribonuclease D
MIKNNSNAVMIVKKKQLVQFIEKIKDEKILFIDTEFHREKTYYATLCLIQIAAGDHLAAIDPLVNGMDLAPLLELLNDETILKVFHAGKQDLEIFYKLNNDKPLKNIFDTQIAALALGLGEQVGYANLVKQLLNITIDKSQQIANWQKRPLSSEQIEYAMYDVIYLQKVYYIMIEQLQSKQRLELIKEDLLRLEDAKGLSVDVKKCYKSIKLRDKGQLTLTILQRLAEFREQEAQNHNKFRNAILRDEFLGYCARLKPTTIEDLELVRGSGKKIISKYGEKIVSIIKEVKSYSKEQLIKPESEVSLPIVDSNVKMLANFLLQLKAKEHEISIKLITDSSDLTMFLASDKNDSKLRESWRWELFGKDLEKLRKGELLIGVKGRRIVLKDTIVD